MLNSLIFAILTYLFSSIPFGLLIGKIFYKIDVRKAGSFNIGATNVMRLCGKIAGITTFLLDGLKGAIPVWICKMLFTGDFFYVIAIISIIGHIFPIYLKFQGGKGVATTIMVLFAINLQIGILAIGIWSISLLLFGFSSLSSILMSILLIPFSLALSISQNNYGITIFNLVFASLILIKHNQNIKRLLQKKEQKIFKKSLF